MYNRDGIHTPERCNARYNRNECKECGEIVIWQDCDCGANIPFNPYDDPARAPGVHECYELFRWEWT